MRIVTATLCTLSLISTAVGAQQEPIATDRPGLLFTTSTVPPGLFQVESGVDRNSEDDAGLDIDLDSVTAQLRWGIRENLEVRIGGPVYNRVEIGTPIGDFDESGIGDLELGVKWRLADGAGGGPAFSLIPSVVLPTGDEEFTADDPVAVLNAVVSSPLAAGWSGTGVVGVRSGDSDAEGSYTDLFAGALAGHALPWAGWSGYVEAGWTEPEAGDGYAQVGGGLLWLLSDDLQLDASLDVGVNDEAPDLRIGAGASVRF